jgi:hypothetical protein
MRHLKPEEIVTYVYGEGSARWMRTADEHLRNCPDCAASIAAFREDAAALSAATAMDAASLSAEESGERIWAAIEPTVRAESPAAARQTWRFPSLPRRTGWQMGLALAACCVLIAGVAFYAGRAWEKRQKEIATQTQQQRERAAVLMVLRNHLDRSERFLVALNHPEDAEAQSEELRAEAQALLQENQTCLKNLPKNAPAVTAVLQDLDAMLRDVATMQDNATTPLAQPEFHRDAGELLFETRVLREHLPNQRTNSSQATQGGSI